MPTAHIAAHFVAVPCPKCNHCRNTKELFQECLNAEDEDDEEEEEKVEEDQGGPAAPAPPLAVDRRARWRPGAVTESDAVASGDQSLSREWALEGLAALGTVAPLPDRQWTDPSAAFAPASTPLSTGEHKLRSGARSQGGANRRS
jgi:hypothetical protein